MALLLSKSSRNFACQAGRSAAYRTHHRRYSTRTTETPEIYDVVTVGGGPVGLAILAALKSSPVTAHLKCALIETQDLTKSQKWSLPPDQYSNRASSLTSTNVDFLDQIGAWRHVDQSRIQPYDEMQVWDAANNSSLQFDWKDEAVKYNAPPRTVATMTENLNLTRGLLARISELGAEDCLFSNTSVSKIQNGRDEVDGFNLSSWPVLSLNSTNATSTIATRLLIGADGFNSPVRSFAGIASHGWDYNRHGVVATLKLQPEESTTFTDPQSASFDELLSNDGASSNRATAFQRFLPSCGGPIAILPLPDHHASLVWSTTPEIAAYLKTVSPESLTSIINAALRLNQTDIKYLLSLPSKPASTHEEELTWRLSHTPHPSTTTTTSVDPPTVLSVQPGTVASFPLRLRHTTTYTGPHIALAGDAAHTIHPLAGQGLNLGLADASSLSSMIAYAIDHGMDIGDPMTLERYGSDRFGKGLMMAMGTDGFHWAYQIGGPDAVLGDGILGSIAGRIRGVGMDLVGSIPGLKSLIMRRAE